MLAAFPASLFISPSARSSNLHVLHEQEGKASTVSCLQSSLLENRIMVAFVNARVIRNSMGSCRASFSCKPFCTSFSLDLQKHTESLRDIYYP